MTRHLSELFNRPFANDPVIAGVTADSRKVTAGWVESENPGTGFGRHYACFTYDNGTSERLEGKRWV